MADAYVVTMPEDARTKFNGVDAVVVYANNSADAIAMAKCQFDGDSDDGWADATATAISAGSGLSGYSLRIRVDSAAGARLYDETVSGDDTVAVKATGTLTLTPGAIADDTVRLGSFYYKFAADPTTGTPDGSSGSPFLVDVGADDAASLANLRKAINATGVAGTDYAAEVVVNPDAEATASNATTLSARALVAGTAGNAIATAVTATGGADGLAWGASTLAGGQDAATFDTFGTAMVAALEAAGGSALTPSYNSSTNVLTVAAIADGIGNGSLRVEFYKGDNPLTVPGLVGTITDEGIAGAVLSVAFGADNYSLPSAPVKLSSRME